MKVMKDTKGETRCLRTLIPQLAVSSALSAVQCGSLGALRSRGSLREMKGGLSQRRRARKGRTKPEASTMKIMKDMKGGTRCLRVLIPQLAVFSALSAVT